MYSGGWTKHLFFLSCFQVRPHVSSTLIESLTLELDLHLCFSPPPPHTPLLIQLLFTSCFSPLRFIITDLIQQRFRTQSILLWHYIQWKYVIFLCNLLLYVIFLKVKKNFQWCWTVYQLNPEMTLNLLTLLIIVWNMGAIYIFGPND